MDREIDKTLIYLVKTVSSDLDHHQEGFPSRLFNVSDFTNKQRRHSLKCYEKLMCPRTIGNRQLAKFDDLT